jgi:intracellular sulfur oxidation DsrE/DsrF family protein
MTNLKDTIILITGNGMGQGEAPLRHKLIGTYLTLLNDTNTLPAAICFYTDGVKLVVSGSPVLGQLDALQEKGVHLIVCSTCLNYYNLMEDLQVGIAGGMTDIIEAQTRAAKVITL